MTQSTQPLFPVPDPLICGNELATALDGDYRFVLRCHLPPDHDGNCRVLGWTEAP